MRTVPGEFAGLVEDGGVTCTSPLVCFSNDRAAFYQECEVMQTRLVA